VSEAPTSTSFFYRNLASFTDFRGITNDASYSPAPDDWHVVVADIIDSTSAVASGSYKDVNAVGACCIIAALNASQDVEIPFVFGGDGATLLVPADKLLAIQSGLAGVRQIALDAFNLQLRVGAISVDALRKLGHDVRVAKYAVSESVTLAMLAGSGVLEAEHAIKKSESVHLLDMRGGSASLQGLECRWQPIHSRNGTVVSLIVVASDVRSAIYESVLDMIEGLTGNADIRPVTPETLKLATDRSSFASESRAKSGKSTGLMPWLRALHVGVVTSIGRILLATGLSAGGFDGKEYLESVVKQTDFRKFDGALRMTVDLSVEQVNALDKFLREQHNNGELFYGIHRSNVALMTCFIRNYKDEHIHFIDGGSGGYAIAAQQLKEQMKNAS